ncbi:MAG: transcriptional regulator [Thaumarchaeota archaeon]|nr:transcriptional regulator [Nitrososphaerota archaeon]
MDRENKDFFDSLFMELSSESRRSMLSSLDKKAQRLSALGTTLNMTIQETHRNAARLEDIGLIRRDGKNTFSLTTCGKIALNLLPSFQFLTDSNSHFKEHDIGNIPTKFVYRIGDLLSHEKITGIGPVLEKWKNVIRDSKEYLKIIIQPYPLEVAKEAVHSVTNRQVKFSYIFGENTITPKERSDLLQKNSWDKFIEKGIVERRMLKSVDTSLIVTENQAMIMFPNINGEIDLNTAFLSKDAQFREWCLDFFNYQWDHAYRFNESIMKKV